MVIEKIHFTILYFFLGSIPLVLGEGNEGSSKGHHTPRYLKTWEFGTSIGSAKSQWKHDQSGETKSQGHYLGLDVSSYFTSSQLEWIFARSNLNLRYSQFTEFHQESEDRDQSQAHLDHYNALQMSGALCLGQIFYMCASPLVFELGQGQWTNGESRIAITGTTILQAAEILDLEMGTQIWREHHFRLAMRYQSIKDRKFEHQELQRQYLGMAGSLIF